MWFASYYISNFHQQLVQLNKPNVLNWTVKEKKGHVRRWLFLMVYRALYTELMLSVPTTAAHTTKVQEKGQVMEVKHLSLLVLFISAASLGRRCDTALAPALFVLGDSTVDTGNQNYITSIVKSNYPPYGKDFVPPGPTGRFCNGKLATDFLGDIRVSSWIAAEYLGLPPPVNFLSPSARGSILQTGVNLASSGSGYLDITGQLLGVVNLTKQLDNLGTVQADIIQQLGKPETLHLFSESIFLISMGGNDFVNNYNVNPVLREAYNPQQFKQLLFDSINKNLQTLYVNYGARKVIIDSFGPVGCAPEQLNLFGSEDGKCLENVNEPLVDFNVGLKSLVVQMRGQYPDYDLLYANVYDPVYSFITNPSEYGFIYGNTACCGEGPWKGLPCVDPVSDVCANANEYVFWDLFHPTQMTYKFLANGIISGDPSAIFPTNLNGIL